MFVLTISNFDLFICVQERNNGKGVFKFPTQINKAKSPKTNKPRKTTPKPPTLPPPQPTNTKNKTPANKLDISKKINEGYYHKK